MASAKEENLNQYIEYNKTLRAWLVGFGFGGPAIFVINEGAQKALLASMHANFIITLFLIGAAAQVFLAFLNKTIGWCAYYKHEKNSNVSFLVKLFAAMESWFWIDVFLDLVSLSTFTWAIFLVWALFLPSK